MFFIPLSQVESVELVIHALRVAGGQADCMSCPAARVCMKQCLSIAEAVQKMVQTGTLPMLGEEPAPEPPAGGPSPGKGRLQVVK
jgi:hypothetical protein